MKNIFTTKSKIVLLYFFLTQLLPAQPGTSLDFDGLNDNVQLPLINFSAGNKMTVEAWIKPTNITSNMYYEISRQENSPYPDWLVSFQNNGTILSFGLKTTTGYTELDVPITASNYTDGNWHHIAATYNGNIKYLYVDGVQIGSEVKTGNITYTGFGHYIGSQAGVNEFFKGQIDEVRYWNIARTQCEINTFKNIEIPTSITGLIGNYHFNQGIAAGNNATVTTLTDAAGTVGTGTLIGYALTGTVSNWVASSPLLAKITGPTVICQGTGVNYSVTAIPGAISYNWSLPATWVPAPPGSNSITTVAGSGSGNITVTATSTCTTTTPITISVTVNPLPVVVAVTTNSVLCTGQSATLTASGASTYTWNPGGTGISISISPTVTTNYTVTGTSAQGCNKTTVFTQSVSTCIGINEVTNLFSGLDIYPNPFNNKLTVKSGSTQQTIQVFNGLGSLVYSAINDNETTVIDLSQQSNGIYFIRVGAITKKVVKQ